MTSRKHEIIIQLQNIIIFFGKKMNIFVIENLKRKDYIAIALEIIVFFN